MDFGTSVSCCSLGALCSCCACILSLMCHLRWGLHCPSPPPQPALLLALLWAGPQILLELGLLEQTSHSFACGSSPMLSSTAPFPALHVLSRPWALVFGSDLSVFGAQVKAVGQGSCEGTAQERLGWLQGLLGKSCQG